MTIANRNYRESYYLLTAVEIHSTIRIVDFGFSRGVLSISNIFMNDPLLFAVIYCQRSIGRTREEI